MTYNFTDRQAPVQDGIGTFAEIAFLNGYDRGRQGRGPVATGKLLKDLDADNALGLLPEHAKIFGAVHRAGNEAGWLARREAGLGGLSDRDEQALQLIKVCGGLVGVQRGQKGVEAFCPSNRGLVCSYEKVSWTCVCKLVQLGRLAVHTLKSGERERMDVKLGSLGEWYRLDPPTVPNNLSEARR